MSGDLECLVRGHLGCEGWSHYHFTHVCPRCLDGRFDPTVCGDRELSCGRVIGRLEDRRTLAKAFLRATGA